MQHHTHLRGSSPLPRLGLNIKGWGNPFVWELSALDKPYAPPLRRAGKGFQWPGRFAMGESQAQFRPTQLSEDTQWGLHDAA